MATRIKMSELEGQIIYKVFGSRDGFQRVEDLLEDLGAERTQFVDALQSLESSGFLSVQSLGENIIVTRSERIRDEPERYLMRHARVGRC